MTKEFEEVVLEIAKQKADDASGAGSNSIINRLNIALKDGAISDFHYRSNMKQLLLAGFEEVESLLLSAVVLLAKNPQIQSALRAEMSSSVPFPYNFEDLDKLPVLLTVILETLRLHPPFPLLTNRYTTRPVLLGGNISLPAGIWIGWNAYAVHTDTRIWGSDTLEFRPNRWGKDVSSINAMFRVQQSKAMFIPFSTRSRTCLGVSFALIQLKIVLYELFSELEWGICNDNMTTLRKVSRAQQRREQRAKLTVYTLGPLVNPSHCKFTLKRTRQLVP